MPILCIVSLFTPVRVSIQCMQINGISRSQSTYVCLALVGTTKIFSKHLFHFIVLLAGCENSSCTVSWLTLNLRRLLHFSHSSVQWYIIVIFFFSLLNSFFHLTEVLNFNEDKVISLFFYDKCLFSWEIQIISAWIVAWRYYFSILLPPPNVFFHPLHLDM